MSYRLATPTKACWSLMKSADAWPNLQEMARHSLSQGCVVKGLCCKMFSTKSGVRVDAADDMLEEMPPPE